MLPVLQVRTAARGVAVSGFSRVQSDPERFARYYLRVANLIMWAGAFAFGFLFITAEPLIVLVLGSQWQKAAPVFQLLVISALGQLLLDSTIWLFVSRGQSGRLLKLLLMISPIIVASYVIGLPFGIQGVALSGSLVFVGILPWILKYSFRGTNLTLQRLCHSIRYPASVGFAGVVLAELALHLIAPRRVTSQLLVAVLSFGAVYLFSVFVPSIRSEVLCFRDLLGQLSLSRQGAEVKPVDSLCRGTDPLRVEGPAGELVGFNG